MSNAAVKRIYAIVVPVDVPAGTHLVRASTPAAAKRHVAGGLLTASVASQEDLVAALQAGTKVETAGELPEGEETGDE